MRTLIRALRTVCFEFEWYPVDVTDTTRKPRDGEKHGVHYYFVPESEFREMIGRGEFLEHATFSGNLYGTRFVVFIVLVTVIVVRGGGVDAR